MFDEELIFFDVEANDQKDLLEKLSAKLIDANYVLASFTDAIIKREQEFPTGLNTKTIGVAIPHTDANHVKESKILFARLAKPVRFQQMGDGADVDVEVVFMLALKEAHSQLETLQSLMALLQDDASLDLLKTADKKTLLNLLQQDN